jgi:hypothetical protein
MRISAQLICLAASLAAAPAFAQSGKDSGLASASPQSLAQPTKTGQAAKPVSPSLNLGLGFSKGGTERTLLPIAPVQKDQLELTWQPAGKWGLTLDLTSRAPNELFPREEVTAGVSYQVTPRFRFGGGVTVKGDSLAQSLSSPTQNFAKDGNEASVRIESAFSF